MDSLIKGLIGHTVSANSGPAHGGSVLYAWQVSLEDSGAYRVNGVVEIFGSPNTPARRAVRLINWKAGRIVREVVADQTTGVYSFDNVSVGPWLIISHDYTGTYNAVVADNVIGELM